MRTLAMLRGTGFAALSIVLFASSIARAQQQPPPTETPTQPPATTPPPATATPPSPATPPTPATPATPPTPPAPSPSTEPTVAGQPAPVEPTPPPERHHGRRWGGHDSDHRHLNYGGYGYAAVGLMSGDFSAMEGLLGQQSALGAGYGPANAGFTFGGGGGGLWNRLWIGGKGFGVLISTADSDRGTASLTGAGGGGELGYAVIANNDWIVVPFVGVGGFGYTLNVKNARTTALPVYAGESVPVGGERTYSAGFITGEVGLRVTRLLFSGSGGLIAGAEIGYMSSMQRAAWENTATEIGGPESADLRGAYFRLIIGGGAFTFESKQPAAPDPKD